MSSQLVSSAATSRGRVLLIGGSGQLGLALGSVFAATTEVIATAHQHAQPGQVLLDLGDTDATARLLRRWRPDLVLIAAAMCHVDRCQVEPDLCRRINVDGPAVVAEFARQHGARVVFFSTDHVFDGSAASPYRETDAVGPLSVYAASKMEAEVAIRTLAPNHHLIVRTGWVYGPDLQWRNFVLRLIQRLRDGEAVEVPTDQVGSPTFTGDLAQAVHLLVERGATGTFHATGPEPVDRVSLATRVCGRFGLDPRRLVPRPTSALAQPAQRSLRVLLDCGKLRAAGAAPFRGIDAGLDVLASWLASNGQTGSGRR